MGPSRKLNSRRALVEDVGAGEVGGQQVRGELGAGELQAERLRQGARRQRLAQTGQVLEQHVAAGEHTRQHQGHLVALPHEGGVDGVEHLLHERGGLGLGERGGGAHSESISLRWACKVLRLSTWGCSASALRR